MKTVTQTEINKEHKPGYKLTKLGWIPKEWNRLEFGEFTTKNNEKYNPQIENGDENPVCIELENIEQGTGRLLNYIFANNQKSIKNKFNKGQILFGKLRPYLKKFWFATFNGVCSSEIWVLYSVSNKIENKYLYYVIQSHDFIELTKVSSGTKMPRADWEYISKIPFILPPLPEQQKIAQILSTWDKAIEKTEQLIHAKTQLKKGLMQQLLTGRKRFKEFAGEKWEEYVLGDLGKTFNGLSGKSKNDFGSGYPYIPYLNVINNSRVNPDQMDNVSVDSNEKQNAVKYGDIFFTTSSETPEEAGMPSVLLNELDTTYLNSFCFGFRLHNFDVLSPAFARFYLRSYLIRKDIYRLAQGSTRYNISKKEVVKIKILLPSNEEQQKIASFLSSLEEELIVLDKRLLNFSEQKKGLMQKLLTGEVRVKLNNLKMNNELNKQLEKLILLIDKLSISTNKIGVSFHGKKGSELKLKGFIYLDLMQRINANLEALLVLLKGLNTSPEFKSSIAIILRTCLSDVLTGYYLYTFMKDETSFENEVKVLGIDYANYIIAMVEDEPKFNPHNISKTNKIEYIKQKKNQIASDYTDLIKDYDEDTGKLTKYKPADLRANSSSELFFSEADKKSPITDKHKYERLLKFDVLFNQAYIYILIRFYAQFHHYGYFNREVNKLDLLSNFAFVVQSFHQITAAILTFGGFIEADSKLLANVEEILAEFEGFYGLTKKE